MIEEVKLQRRRAADAARAYQEKKLSWEQFMEEFGAIEDALIGEFVDLIEHEPKRGGFMGASEKAWGEYQAEVAVIIAKLES